MTKISSSQARMARAGLDWSIRKLSQRADVCKGTVMRFEDGKNLEPKSINKIYRAFRAYIIFSDDGLSVRLIDRCAVLSKTSECELDGLIKNMSDHDARLFACSCVENVLPDHGDERKLIKSCLSVARLHAQGDASSADLLCAAGTIETLVTHSPVLSTAALWASKPTWENDYARHAARNARHIAALRTMSVETGNDERRWQIQQAKLQTIKQDHPTRLVSPLVR